MSLSKVPAASSRARLFNWTFAGCVMGGLTLAALGMLLLGRAERLPPPPFTATPCIDDKFQFLHAQDLEPVDFVAIGSSVTLHSLNLQVLQTRFPAMRPVNAAPCHLHIDQAAFMTDFLLERMSHVHTVMTLVSPRDFENCDPRDTAFFDTWKARRYVFDKTGAALVYLTGFRPGWFLHEIQLDQRRKWMRFGSRAIYQTRAWNLRTRLDSRCMQALQGFESRLGARGIRLIVVTHPVMPAWSRAMDGDGRFTDQWYTELARALRRPGTVLIDGRRLALADEEFADPLHLLWPATPRLANFIADHLQERKTARR